MLYVGSTEQGVFSRDHGNVRALLYANAKSSGLNIHWRSFITKGTTGIFMQLIKILGYLEIFITILFCARSAHVALIQSEPL